MRFRIADDGRIGDSVIDTDTGLEWKIIGRAEGDVFVINRGLESMYVMPEDPPIHPESCACFACEHERHEAKGKSPHRSEGS